MTREQKRIAAAARSRRYWDAEMVKFAAIDDTMLFAFRWLRALKKIERRRGSAQKTMANAYLSDLSERMLAVARQISAIDQMTGEQAWDFYEAWQKQLRRGEAL
jgi:hypothetical protein